MKKFARDIIILHMHQKSQSYDVWFLRYGVRQAEFFIILFGSFFAILTPPALLPLMILKIKILKKKEKYDWRYYPFIHMCTINEDHMIYGSWNIKVQQTESFVILGHFLPYQPPDNLENQNFKIEKNTWSYYHFTHLHHKLQLYDVWLLK